MKHSTYIFFAFSLLLTGCSFMNRPSTEMAKPGAGSVFFECRDGVKFSIAFNKKNDNAVLIFNGHSTPEVLDNRKLASGIEYGNDDYAFREHGGVTKLVDLTQDDGVESTCHRIKEK